MSETGAGAQAKTWAATGPWDDEMKSETRWLKFSKQESKDETSGFLKKSIVGIWTWHHGWTVFFKGVESIKEFMLGIWSSGNTNHSNNSGIWCICSKLHLRFLLNHLEELWIIIQTTCHYYSSESGVQKLKLKKTHFQLQYLEVLFYQTLQQSAWLKSWRTQTTSS